MQDAKTRFIAEALYLEAARLKEPGYGWFLPLMEASLKLGLQGDIDILIEAYKIALHEGYAA